MREARKAGLRLCAAQQLYFFSSLQYPPCTLPHTCAKLDGAPCVHCACEAIPTFLSLRASHSQCTQHAWPRRPRSQLLSLAAARSESLFVEVVRVPSFLSRCTRDSNSMNASGRKRKRNTLNMKLAVIKGIISGTKMHNFFAAVPV